MTRKQTGIPKIRDVLAVATMAITATMLPFKVPQHLSVSAYVTSGLPARKHRAWLKKMTYEICQSPPGDLTPEMLSSTADIMHAWAQNPYNPPKSSSTELSSQSSSGTHHGKECALAVECLLKRLIDERRAGNKDAVATTAAYNAMLEGWSRSGEKGAAAERAEQILMQMQDMYAAGDGNVQPDLRSFRAVISAWHRSGEEFAAYRAQRVLEWMISLHEAKENDKAIPDVECFDIVLHTWARSGHESAPRKAEKLIIAMEKLSEAGNEAVKPHTQSFNAVLLAWSKSTEMGASQRAQDILDHMERLSDAGFEDVKPNSSSYSTVAGAWAKSSEPNSALRAEGILDRIEAKCKAGDLSLRPDTIIYNHVINAWEKCPSKGSYKRARTVLDRQISLYNDGVKKCCPDVYSYTSVLSSCASTKGNKKKRRQAFDAAISTFEEMIASDHATPNHVTYGTMLKACVHLLLPNTKQREEWVRKIFHLACQNGCVGEMVLSRLRDAATLELYKELMAGHTKKNLPLEWTCNVPQERRQSRPSSKTSSKKKMQQKNILLP